MIGLGQDKQQHPAVHAEELAGGGSVAVAVGVSDMWQVTGDKQHITPDKKVYKLKLDFFVLVLLYTHVGIFSVSRMRDF